MSSIGYIDRVTQEYTDHMTIFRDTVQSNLSVSVKYVNGKVSRYSIFKRFNQLGVWEEMNELLLHDEDQEELSWAAVRPADNVCQPGEERMT